MFSVFRVSGGCEGEDVARSALVSLNVQDIDWMTEEKDNPGSTVIFMLDEDDVHYHVPMHIDSVTAQVNEALLRLTAIAGTGSASPV